MTYSKQHSPKRSASKEADPEIFRPYTPADMGDDDGLNLAPYRDQLCTLHNKMASLPLSDKSEEFNKVSTSLSTARKNYYENIDKRHEALAKISDLQAARDKASGPISDAEFDEDLIALRDLLKELPDAAYKSSGGPMPDVSAAALMVAEAAQHASKNAHKN